MRPLGGPTIPKEESECTCRRRRSRSRREDAPSKRVGVQSLSARFCTGCGGAESCCALPPPPPSLSRFGARRGAPIERWCRAKCCCCRRRRRSCCCFQSHPVGGAIEAARSRASCRGRIEFGLQIAMPARERCLREFVTTYLEPAALNDGPPPAALGPPPS